ncbi:TPA: DUF4179 domain-containing protein [Clostridium perfringens]|nr:DUF4179 domain-containing protein [Clostridium perfringens]HAT4208560.1 DUF4179 domain-containing protein [Clostridium perfringens]
MIDDFDRKLFEMARESKVKEPNALKAKVDYTFKKLKKNKFNFRHLGSIAAILIFCILSVGIYFPTYAMNIPILGDVVEILSNKFNLSVYEINAQNLNYQVSNEDYTLTIESAYYDGIETTFFFKIKGNEKLNKSGQYFFEANFKYNEDISYEGSLEKGEFIDEYTFAGMMTFYINPYSGNKLPEKFNIKFSIPNIIADSEILAVNSDTLNLSFDIKDLNVKETKINKEIQANENSILISSIKKYPTSIVIDYDEKFNNPENKLSFILWHETLGQINYLLPRTPEKLFIVPKTRSKLNVDNLIKESMPLSIGETKTFGKVGKVSIENIETKDGKTYISIRKTGDINSYDFNIIKKENINSKLNMYEYETKVIGILDTLTTYVIPDFTSDIDYLLEYEYISNDDIEILYDQIIEIN